MKKILVTGANRGIGLELCRQLTARGDAVTAVCRSGNEALEQLKLNVIDGVDVADTGSVNRLVSKLQGEKFDWLINNAGILSRGGLENPDFEAIEQQFKINAIGPLRITHALLGMLSAGSKVAIITSRMGSLGDNTSGGYYGYRMSKAAVNMAGVSLAKDLKEHEIAVALLHPGMVATEMTGRQGVPVNHAVKGLIQRVDELNMKNTGTFWHAEGEVLPW